MGVIFVKTLQKKRNWRGYDHLLGIFFGKKWKEIGLIQT